MTPAPTTSSSVRTRPPSRSLRRHDPDQVRRSGSADPLSAPAGAPVRHLAHPTPDRAGHGRGSGWPGQRWSRASVCGPRPATGSASTPLPWAPCRTRRRIPARPPRRRAALPLHRRPPQPRRPRRVRRRRARRRRGHRPAPRQGLDGPLEARDELAALEVLAEACARHGALLAVNDRADVALASGADVLHLGPGRPAGGVGAAGRRRRGDRRAVGAQRRRDRGRRRRAGRRLLLRGSLLADPDQAGPPGAGAGAGPHRGGARRRRGRGSRSAGSTASGSTRCWRRERERVVVVRAITEADDPRAAAAALAARLRA